MQSVPVLLPQLGMWELLIILVIVMLLFGATQIPRLMRGMGQGIHEFKKGIQEGEKPGESGSKTDPAKPDKPEGDKEDPK
jgi:sec-independent protein translocase protein TatA